MKVLFLSILMAVFAYANIVLGHVEQFQGNVKVKNEGSIKKSKVSLNLEINEGDLIVVSKNASAKIKLLDGSLLVLDEQSSIHFTSIAQAEQTAGKVFYKINNS